LKLIALIVVALSLLAAMWGLVVKMEDKQERIPNALAVVIAALLVTLILIINS